MCTRFRIIDAFTASVAFISLFCTLLDCSHVNQASLPVPEIPTGAIAGRLFDVSGKGASCHFVIIQNPYHTDTFITNWDGNFIAPGIEEGENQVIIDTSSIFPVTVIAGETTYVDSLYSRDGILQINFSFISLTVRHQSVCAYAASYPPWGTEQTFMTVYANPETVDLAVNLDANLTAGPWIQMSSAEIFYFHQGKKFKIPRQMSPNSQRATYYITSPFVPAPIDTLDFCAPCEKVPPSDRFRCPRGRVIIKPIPASGYSDTVLPFAAGIALLGAYSGDTLFTGSISDGNPIICAAGWMRLSFVPSVNFLWTRIKYNSQIIFDSLPPELSLRTHYFGLDSINSYLSSITTCPVLHGLCDTISIETSRYFGPDTTKRITLAATFNLVAPQIADTILENPWTHLFITDAAADTCVFARGDINSGSIRAEICADSVNIRVWNKIDSAGDGLFHVYFNSQHLGDFNSSGCSMTGGHGDIILSSLRLTGADTVEIKTDVIQGVSSFLKSSLTVYLSRPGSGIPCNRICLDSVGEIPPAVGIFASPLVSITTGAMHTRLTSDSVMLSREPYPFGGNNMYIGYDRISSIDWGLAVVGPTGDTLRDQSGCTFQNSRYSYSKFSNQMWIAPGPERLELRYTSDKVEWDILDTASYKILVTYVDGPKDSITAFPQLLIVCGAVPLPLSKPLTAVYQASPDSTIKLHKGETWYAGDLEVPAMKFKPAGPVRLQKLAE